MTEPASDSESRVEEREVDEASLSSILEEIDELEPGTRDEFERIVFDRIVLERHQELRGSFQFDGPPPWLLREYEAIIPNAGDRWMQLTEEQSRHRRHIETVVIEGDAKRAARGLDYGFAAVALVIVAAVIAMFLGYPKLAAVLIAIDLAALASTFIYGSITRRNERESRRGAPPPGPTSAE